MHFKQKYAVPSGTYITLCSARGGNVKFSTNVYYMYTHSRRGKRKGGISLCSIHPVQQKLPQCVTQCVTGVCVGERDSFSLFECTMHCERVFLVSKLVFIFQGQPQGNK